MLTTRHTEFRRSASRGCDPTRRTTRSTICLGREGKGSLTISIRVVLSMLLAGYGGTAPAAEAVRGESLFAKFCGDCHLVSDIEGSLKTTAANREIAKARMREFLAGHGDADAATAKEIVEYLSREANP